MANWSTQSAIREYQVNSNGKLTVVERLASLLETGQYADVAIKVGSGDDAKTFKAHRILLATASEPLNSLVQSSGHRGDNNMTIHVTDIDPQSFQHVLKYIYTDDVRVSCITDAINLIKYSEKWGLDSLGVETIKFMKQFLDEFEPTSEDMKNDLCELVIWAEEGKYEKMKERCWEVLLKYVNEVVPCESFLNMDEDTVRKMITHKDFKFNDQLLLFEAIRDWGMNQVLKNNMNVNQLQSVISRLLKHIDFEGIQDNDFLSTIMPSACLGKAELISYFMSRGMEIPRDLEFNNNERISTVKKNGSVLDFEKACRFKRGYKIPDKEIYQEHELRFRVDKDLVLLGVGFGFLFSNTDMGVTVHCQGPWETRQWTDITQTYCRVSYENMKTADIRLMFREPVAIQANQSYKILVRVGRMSAGASEVDLWGGGDGQPSVKTKDAQFYFLNKAVDPKKKVEEKDIDNKPSMITELIFEPEGYTPPSEEAPITGVKTSLKKPQANSLDPLFIPSPHPVSPVPEMPSSAKPTSIPRPVSPIPNPPTSPKPWSPTITSKPFARVQSPVRTLPSPFTPPSIAAPQSPITPKQTPLSTAGASPNVSTPSSPLTTRKQLSKVPSIDESKKKSFLTKIKEPEPEPAWVKRKKSMTSEEDKSILNPFRKSNPAVDDNPERVSLPWQRKSSLKQPEAIPSFYLKSRPLSSTASTTSKSLSTTESKLPWSIPRKAETSYTSKYNTREPSLTRNTRESSVSRTRESSVYTPKTYSSLYSKKDNLSTSSAYSSNYKPYGTSSYQSSSKNISSPYSSKYSSSTNPSYSSGYKSLSSISNNSSNLSPYTSSYNKSKDSTSSSITPYGKNRTSTYEPTGSNYSTKSYTDSSKYDSSSKPYSSNQNRQSVSRFDKNESTATSSKSDGDSSKSKYSYLNSKTTNYSKPSYEAPKNFGKTLYSSNPSPSNASQGYNSSPYSSTFKSRFGDSTSTESTSRTNRSAPYSMANPYGSKVTAIASKYTSQPSSSSYYRR